MFQVIFVKTFIVRPIGPSVDPFTIFLSVFKVTLIFLPIFIINEAIGVKLAVVKNAAVLKLWGGVLSFSMLFPIQELTLIESVFGLPLLPAIAIGQIPRPYSFKFVLQAFMIENSFAFGLLIFKFSFVYPTFGANKSALPIGIAFIEVAHIVSAIRVKQLSFSMGNSIQPLPKVNESFLIQSAGFRRCSRRNRKWVFGTKFSRLVIQLFHYGMLLWQFCVWEFYQGNGRRGWLKVHISFQ